MPPSLRVVPALPDVPPDFDTIDLEALPLAELLQVAALMREALRRRTDEADIWRDEFHRVSTELEAHREH